jgi:hypothetical protein
MKAQSRPTVVVQEPLPNKTIWSFQGLTIWRDKNLLYHLFARVRRRCAKSRFQKENSVQNVAVSKNGHCKWVDQMGL